MCYLCLRDVYSDIDDFSDAVPDMHSKRARAVELKSLIRENEQKEGCESRLERLKEEQYKLSREL